MMDKTKTRALLSRDATFPPAMHLPFLRGPDGIRGRRSPTPHVGNAAPGLASPIESPTIERVIVAIWAAGSGSKQA
jgi:hypothetical protein